MNNHSVTINPIVQSLLKQKVAGITEIQGYCGPSEKGYVRVYRDFGLEAYLEIPQKELLHYVDSEDPLKPCRIFFRSEANIKYVVQTGHSNGLALTGLIETTMEDVARITQEIAAASTSDCSCDGSETASAGVGVASLQNSCGMNCYLRSVQCPYGGQWCDLDCYYCYERCKAETGTYDFIGTVGAVSIR